MSDLRRRDMLKLLALPVGAIALSPLGCHRKHPEKLRQAEARRRIELPSGVMSGEISDESAVIWTRASRNGKMIVEWSESETFELPTRVVGPEFSEASDFTGQVRIANLPKGKRIHYRVASLEGIFASEWSKGELKTAPVERRDVLFSWSADTVGQGWGIDEARGGMKIFDAIRKASPDFFLHAGDQIYADGPLKAEVPLPDGSIWRNLMIKEKEKVAETLDEFRGAYRYNLLDRPFRAFLREIPFIPIWDDHEVRNNWHPRQDLGGDPRYQEQNVDVLAARAERAMREYSTLGSVEKKYRSFRYGPSVEVFILDGRTYRSDNSENVSPGDHFLGRAQLDWLKAGLAASKATWKIVLSDMPFATVIPDPPRPDQRVFQDGWANGEGPPRGRELELAELLSFMKKEHVRNLVVLTGDVHHAAVHEFHPDRAAFKHFDPFFEFVAGPLHAGSFAPGPIDPTFGAEVRYTSPKPTFGGPSEGLQYFGLVRVDGKSERLRLSLHDIDGREVFGQELVPAG